MTDFKGIRGWKVQTLSTDPVASGVDGAVWTAGGNLPQALYENAGAGATQNASMNFGGQGNSPSPAFPHSAETQLYNGSTWTEVNDLNTSRRFLAGAGTQTSALGYGGYTVPPSATGTLAVCESWDGTNWTEVADLNTKRREMSGIGTSNTNALCVQGQEGTAVSSAVESWNGTTWTEVAEANTLRFRSANTGSNTAGLIAGGEIPSTAASAVVESWNGSAWTEISDINTSRQQFVAAGTYTEALVMGGDLNPGLTGKTEYYDGSSWSEKADLSNARYINYGSSGDTVAQALVFGGSTGSRTDSTEEWTQPSTFQKLNLGQVYFNSTANAFKVTEQPVPGGTWASGGSLNTARSSLAGSTRGSQTSSIAFGGFSGTWLAVNENYNGTSWTELADLNTARGLNSGAGTATAALTQGGFTGTARVANTESWNGSAWTEVNDLNTGRTNAGGFGTQTSAAIAGGNLPPSTVYNLAESWDGTSWTEVSELNTGRYGLASLGTGSDGLLTGGETSLGTPGITGKTEKWNGSSWTESGDLNQVRYDWQGGGGETSGGIVFGGYTGTVIAANTEFFNGSTWTELNDLSESVYANTGMGSSVAALNVGGNAPPHTSAVEEWTVPVTNKTITVS